LRTLVTTGLQGKGKTIKDRVQLTGKNDYETPGRGVREYEMVSMGSPSGIENTDMLIGVAILGAAVAFILLMR